MPEINLGINLQDAEELIKKYIKDPITILHCIESGAIMEALAKHFGEDDEKWKIIGLLHDIDWELTKDNPAEHCNKAPEILKQAGTSDFLIETIISHGYGYAPNEKLKDKERNSRIQYCLISAETLTGLIIASTLILPDRKLSSLKLESLKKRFKNLKFAANCDREKIKECEKAGIGLDEFLGLGLKALQEIADELGM